MKERFDPIPELGPLARLEKLESGIYLEIIRQDRTEEEVEESLFAYGDFYPQETPWYMFCEVRGREDLSWKELEEQLNDWGIVESHSELSLSTLADMLDEGEQIFCLVNDFALAENAAADLPGLSGNTLLWVSGLDLEDYDCAAVYAAPLGSQPEAIPLKRFMKAWQKGNCQALSVQTGG